MNARPLLEVQEAIVHYGTARGAVPAVEGVSFTLRAREAVAIVGESGSGKTSLALYLMRLLPRNTLLARGRVFLGGLEVSA